MAQLWSTGPSHLFLSYMPLPYNDSPDELTRVIEEDGDPSLGYRYSVGGLDTGLNYLGTCEAKPHISIIRHWEGVYADDSSKVTPYDLMYQGQEALITVALSRWSEQVYQNLVLANYFATGIGVTELPALLLDVGVEGPESVGKLLITNRIGTMLTIVFPNSVRDFYNGTFDDLAGVMPNGYRFYATTLVDHDDVKPGTEHLVRYLQFRALRVKHIPSRNATLFDMNVDVPAHMAVVR